MQINYIEIKEFGGPEVLVENVAESRSVAADEILVRVAGAGVNPIDFKTRRGTGFVAEKIKNSLPWIPGYDFSGTVLETGSEASQWMVGDNVMGMAGFPYSGGAYSSHLVIRAANVVEVPDSLSLIDAAGIPLAALTAWQALFDAGALEKGSKVLIHAGAGGVGHFAVQFAKTFDAHVIATASPDHHDFLHEIGVDEVIDYNTVDFSEECYGLDFVLDCVGGQVGIQSLNVLCSSGRLITVPTATAPGIIEAGRQAGIATFGLRVQPDLQQLAEILELIDTGEVKVCVDQRISMSDCAAAHLKLESGHTRGKIVLLP
ncbi:MAG: alcohol dehydrogenase [Gammaproteobacteria bacterium]|nr:MAG: alcohol dehydrogenase [Pseudomonadota bacterium]PIE38155.1 MAG: alcohol dehydrogenase [Gammaproteobacteria bacterium]